MRIRGMKLFEILGLAIDYKRDEMVVAYEEEFVKVYGDVVRFYWRKFGEGGGNGRVRFSEIA